MQDESQTANPISQREIGAWLLACRERAGLTQNAVAHAIGKNNQQISSWERGVKAMSAENFLALCFLYRADPTEIIGLAKKATGARRVG